VGHNVGVRFLVVTTGRRAPLSDDLARAICSVHPDAEVRFLRCDARLESLPGPHDLLPQLVEADGLRWADLVLAFGCRRAGWAVLPWVLDTDDDVGGPLVVIEDTFEVSGALAGLLEGSEALAARALHVDPDAGAWGGFAPGLLVMSTAGGGWASWWRQRVVEAARAPLPLAVDPWWELPTLTGTITDPRFCLSAHTAAEIELGELSTAPPLVDYAGLDPRAPWWFAPPGSEPTVFLSEMPGLRALCRARSERMLAAGWTPEVEREERILPGLTLTPELRRWYRRWLGEDEEVLPPNPLVAGEVEAFLQQLRESGGPDGAGAGVHVDLLMQRRRDLREAFPHPRWRDRHDFRRWLWSYGLSERETSLLTLGEPPAVPRPVGVSGPGLPFGVNVVGYSSAELGLGVAVRRVRRALEAVGVPHSEIVYDRTSSSQRFSASGEAFGPYHFNLLVITPDQLPLFVEDVGPQFLSGHHNIGLWFWESDVTAPQQEKAFELVQEIWVATEYLTRAFRRPGGPPVHVVPTPLVFEEPAVGPSERARIGLDERFTFLFSFDFLSEPYRKNPLGLAEAYRRAFPDASGSTRLLIKTINGSLFPEVRERIACSVADRADVELWDSLLSSADRLALVAAADCYVSLHRAEGLGLTMAEAMAVGTPVIATGYSGNLDFMPEGSALLVPGREVEVGEGRYYPAHGHWADPDLDAAAAMMRRIAQDPQLRRDLADAGRRALRPFSFTRVGEIARAALLESWSRRGG
jgi:glycosyltransferase involved in cell wall biosynthesis